MKLIRFGKEGEEKARELSLMTFTMMFQALGEDLW
jgi:hypothetical protein